MVRSGVFGRIGRSTKWLATAVVAGLHCAGCTATVGALPTVTSARGQQCQTATPIVTGARTDTPVARWLAKTPFFVAHRGGDASWVEGTSDAYLTLPNGTRT